MSIFEIIGGVLLIFFGLAVVVSVTLQEHKTNLGGALGGSMNEGTYDRGRTKTMDAQLSMISKFSGIAMCVVALAVLAATPSICNPICQKRCYPVRYGVAISFIQQFSRWRFLPGKDCASALRTAFCSHAGRRTETFAVGSAGIFPFLFGKGTLVRAIGCVIINIVKKTE